MVSLYFHDLAITQSRTRLERGTSVVNDAHPLTLKLDNKI